MKINPKAVLIREVTTKVVQILASKKIKVTQRGTRAYVQYHEKTLEPILVNIPYIPDDANDELLDAIQGFIDHELGHIFFTDPKAIVAANKKGVGSLHNALEDTYVERKQRDNYKGSGSNLENVGKFFLKNFTMKKLKEDPKNKIAYLMIPAIRAWAGQLLFKEFMDDGDKWSHLKDITARLGPLVKEIPKINSSWEALDLAERMTVKLKAEEKPKSSKPEPKSKPKSEPKDEKFEEPPEETGDGSTGEGTGKGEAGKGSTGKGEKAETPEKEKPKPKSEKGDGEDDKFEEEPEKDEKFGGSPAAEGDDEGSAEDGEFGETIVEGDGDDEEFAGDKDTEGDAKAAKTTETGKGSDDVEYEPAGSLLEDIERMGDYDDALEDSLSREVASAAKESDYYIWTKDFDIVETYKPTSDTRSLDRRVEAMQTKSDAMVGVMQKDLERAIAARSLAVWRPGLRKGRINASSLSRLATGDDRVFRRREVAISKDVAISLLVDNSGSMSGSRIQTASDAAFAMSSVLDRMNIANEVLGFSAHYKRVSDREFDKAASDAGVTFARTLPLYIPIYKAFDERLTPETKRRIAAMAIDGGLLQENVDGESVQIAAQRLMKRKEKRHILMVFSDGQPACPGNNHQLRAHLKNSVKMIEQSGVDVIGIGIQTKAVEQYYSKHVVLNDVDQLAGEVMQQLRKFLLN